MNKLIGKIFIIVLLAGFMLQVLMADEIVSYSERRTLQAFPELSLESIMSGEFMEDFESYGLDQFAFRDFFRGMKSMSELYVFGKKDVNGIYVYNGHLIKKTQAFDPNSLTYFSDYIRDMTARFGKDASIYVSMVPDKNYFTDRQTLNYEVMEKTLDSLESMTYIPMMDLLRLEDYFKTDTHWKQDKLLPVVNRIYDYMNSDWQATGDTFIQKDFDAFKGVYAGQSGLYVKEETLSFLTNDTIDALKVENYRFEDRESSVYEYEFLVGKDAYEVFLGGASPLVVIENPKAHSPKELIVFRDSFGSSLIPLMVDKYAKITLVDTRYIHSSILGQYMEFADQDVLFLYNSEVINQAYMLK